MPWSEWGRLPAPGSRLRASGFRTALLLVLASIVSAATPSDDEKRISIYSSVANYSLTVLDRAGTEYVALLEVLEPLGRVSSTVEGRRWKLRYNNIDSEFVEARARCRIRGLDVDLTGPFHLENSRGLVPVSSLTTILPRFLGSSVSLHSAARRMFIGNIGTQVNAQLNGTNPPRLILNFTAPVNPTIATEPGKLRMVFKREPLILPANQSLLFENPVIKQADFSEQNGTAELDVIATTPLMATFADGGKTIMITAAAATPRGPNTNASEQSPASTERDQVSPASSSRILVIVDPAHGGNERGAALTDTLAEKTVTLGFARLLRHELEKQGFAVVLLREGDDSVTLDQRAGIVNASHAGLYIGLHAASQGSGVRIYTALLPTELPRKTPFLPWNSAQSAALPVSQTAASAIVSALQSHELPARAYSASLRPLNNVSVPAVSAELGPGSHGVTDLPSANYQQKAAAAIADGVSKMHDQLRMQP